MIEDKVWTNHFGVPDAEIKMYVGLGDIRQLRVLWRIAIHSVLVQILIKKSLPRPKTTTA